MRWLLAMALLAGCVSGSGTWKVDSEPTRTFPKTWDGRTAAPPPRPAQQSAPAPVERPPAEAKPAQPARRPEVATAGKLVAVLEFKSRLKGADAEAVDAGYFSNSVRALVKQYAPESRVMTRENVLVILQSAGKSLADCEGECEVDTGRRLGADLVVSGDLVRVGTRLKLELRLHETHEGQLLSGVTASGKSVDDLDTDLERTVRTLLAP